MGDGIGNAWWKQEHRSLIGKPLDEGLFGEMKPQKVDDDDGTVLLLIL
jgi:hypothetical protein